MCTCASLQFVSRILSLFRSFSNQVIFVGLFCCSRFATNIQSVWIRRREITTNQTTQLYLVTHTIRVKFNSSQFDVHLSITFVHHMMHARFADATWIRMRWRCDVEQLRASSINNKNGSKYNVRTLHTNELLTETNRKNNIVIWET